LRIDPSNEDANQYYDDIMLIINPRVKKDIKSTAFRIEKFFGSKLEEKINKAAAIKN